MKKIYFRADASSTIGYGHFVRTLALADILRKDFECIFVTQSPTEYQKSEVEKVCKLVSVHATDEKFEQFLEMLQGDEIVVLDNYFYSTDYQLEIKKKGCRLVCIDDMHDKHYVADVLINHALDKRELFSGESYTKYCLGLKWALLRRPFLDAVCEKRSDQENNIVVCVGGADPYNLNRKIVERIADVFDYEKLFVISGAASHLDKLGIRGVEVYRNLSGEEIVRLFAHAKFGVFSASTICIEALATGLPVCAGYYVDNQEEFYHSLVSRHFAYGLGNLLNDGFDFSDYSSFDLCFNRTIMEGIRERYLQVFYDIMI